MSISLRVENGDLALSGSQFGTVSGAQKLIQDLTCAVLTPRGFYEVAPEYGSSLNEIEDEVIGQTDWSQAAGRVEAEINRICAEYQRRQIARNQRDAQIYGKTTISAEEMLLKVQGIKCIQVEDAMLVKVTLNNGNGVIEVNVPVVKE